MDPAGRILQIHQGDRPVEDYVEEFCGLCCLVVFNDTALKDIFRFGLSHEISCLMPPHTPHWSLQQYIDFALRISGSAFTVAVVEMEHDTSPKSSVMSATPKPANVKSATPRPVKLKFTHVTP